VLRYAVAFALRGAAKLVRGLRLGLTEEERFTVADDVVDRMKQYGDPWRLSEELPDRTGNPGQHTAPNRIIEEQTSGDDGLSAQSFFDSRS
jgi:hypothetical protein